MARRAYGRLIAPTTGIQPSQRGFLRSTGYYGRFLRRTSGGYARNGRFVRRREVEKKFFDTNIGGLALNATWTVTTSQNLIAQGSGEQQRQGRMVWIKDIHCQGQASLTNDDDGTAPLNPVKVRIMLMLDKQANGMDPTASGTSGVFLNTDINSFHNLANKGRFKTLYEFEEVLNPSAGAGTGIANDFSGEIKIIEFHKKCNIPIEFNAATGAITEIKSNNLFWIAVASTGAVATWLVRTRLRYTDM